MKYTVSFFVNRGIIALSLLLIASCGETSTATTPIPTTTFTPVPTIIPQLPPVEVDHLGLTVEGKPFRFIGANAIYFGFYDQYDFSIDEAIKTAKENGIDVIRIYLGYGKGTWSARPMEEYDKTLEVAAQNGMYVIAVLTDCCCMGVGESQTEESYYAHVPYCNFTDSKALEIYKIHINNILLRENTVNGKIYRDDPTILAWDVANEPFLENFSDSEINNWLSQVTQYIKSIDPNHLLTFGLDASGREYDTEGPYYDALNVPGLDFFSFHYNLPNFFTVSQHLDLIKFRVEKFLSMGKPVVLEEFGVGTLRTWGPYLDEKSLDKWVQAYKNQMDITFSAGGSGAMFWGWGIPETNTVPLWWKNEDHDITETAFCTMLREYQTPALGSFQLSELPTETPNDNFESTIFDFSKWQGRVNGEGNIRQKDGQMVLSVDNAPANSSATVLSTWTLTGDFDIQIDFEIGEGWGAPATDHLDGATFGVDIGGQTYHITRLRSGYDDVFFGWRGDGTVLRKTPTSALIGKYRLVRTDTALVMFYDVGNGWQEFVDVAVPTSNAQVYFMNSSVNASQAFTTYFDNFQVNSGLTTYRP